jgi:hypothetical protein
MAFWTQFKTQFPNEPLLCSTGAVSLLIRLLLLSFWLPVLEGTDGPPDPRVAYYVKILPLSQKEIVDLSHWLLDLVGKTFRPYSAPVHGLSQLL